MSYRPNPESLAARVIGFFALNPGGALSLDDLVDTLGFPGDHRNVHAQLAKACVYGLLIWDERLQLYRKGPGEAEPRREPPLCQTTPSLRRWRRARARSAAPSREA